MFGRGVGGTFAGITLIDPGDFDMVVGDSLHGAGKPFDFATIFSAGWRNVQRKQVSQRIDGYVDFRALLAFAAVIARTLAALRRGTQRSTVDDRGTGFGLSPCRQPQHAAQIVHHRFKAARRQPALRLLVHRSLRSHSNDASHRSNLELFRPRWQVVWHPASRRARLHDVAKAVEHLA